MVQANVERMLTNVTAFLDLATFRCATMGEYLFRDPGSPALVIPVVTPEEMAAIDAAAPEPVEVLIDRAGAAVARAARRLLGGTYGRRVVGAWPARATTAPTAGRPRRRLRRRGVRVDVLDAADAARPAARRPTW